MIQRIQTIYLALIAICGLLMYFFPLVSIVPENAAAEPVIYHLSALTVNVLNNGISSVLMRPWPVVILNAIVIAFSVYTILQYRNRKNQLRFTLLILLLIMAEIVFMVLDVQRLSKVAGTEHMMTFGIYSVLPLLQLLFSRLATGAIKKDEALVRSADRLR